MPPKKPAKKRVVNMDDMITVDRAVVDAQQPDQEAVQASTAASLTDLLQKLRVQTGTEHISDDQVSEAHLAATAKSAASSMAETRSVAPPPSVAFPFASGRSSTGFPTSSVSSSSSSSPVLSASSVSSPALSAQSPGAAAASSVSVPPASSPIAALDLSAPEPARLTLAASEQSHAVNGDAAADISTANVLEAAVQSQSSDAAVCQPPSRLPASESDVETQISQPLAESAAPVEIPVAVATAGLAPEPIVCSVAMEDDGVRVGADAPPASEIVYEPQADSDCPPSAIHTHAECTAEIIVAARDSGESESEPSVVLVDASHSPPSPVHDDDGGILNAVSHVEKDVCDGDIGELIEPLVNASSASPMHVKPFSSSSSSSSSSSTLSPSTSDRHATPVESSAEASDSPLSDTAALVATATDTDVASISALVQPDFVTDRPHPEPPVISADSASLTDSSSALPAAPPAASNAPAVSDSGPDGADGTDNAPILVFRDYFDAPSASIRVMVPARPRKSVRFSGLSAERDLTPDERKLTERLAAQVAAAQIVRASSAAASTTSSVASAPEVDTAATLSPQTSSSMATFVGSPPVASVSSSATPSSAHSSNGWATSASRKAPSSVSNAELAAGAGAPSDRFGGFGGVVNRAAPSNSLSDHSSSLTPAAGTPTILPAYLTSTISSFTSTSLSNSAPLEFAPKPQSMSQSSSRPESQTQPRSSLLSGAISATRAQPVGATAASSASDLNQPEPDMDEDASQYGSSVTISFFQSSRSGSAANGASALASTGQVSALVFDNGAADEDEVSGAQSASARKRPGSGRVYSKHQLHLMEEQDAAEEAGGGGGAVAGAGSRRSTQKAPHSYSSFAAMSGGFGSSKASPAFQPSAGDAGADAGAGAESEAGAGGMAGGARMAHLQLPTPHHHPSFSSSSSSVSSAAAAAAYRRSLYAAVVSPSDVGGVVFTPRDATVREPDPASAATNGPASSSSSSSSPALEAVTVQLPAAHEPLVLRLTDLPAWATASNQKHLLDRQNSRCAECQRPLVARLFAWNSLASPQFCHYTGKLYCGECHVGDQARIPSRVILHLDTDAYAVCRIAKQFLATVGQAPSIRIDMIPASFRDANAHLQQLPVFRRQLHLFQPYVHTCAHKDKLMALIGTRAYLIDFDDGLFSLRDIVETLNNGELCVRLRTTIKQLSDHCTSQCESCRARAFVCELCKSSAAIFPFQVRQVATCPSCQSAFHRDCIASQSCPKCARIAARRQSAASAASADAAK